MRKLYVIGIGAGDPDQLTLQAIKAMNQVDVFFVLGKDDKKTELADLRLAMLAEHVKERAYKVVIVPDPPRERSPEHYLEAVESWHTRRAAVLTEGLSRFVDPDGVAGILVWGDPSLYDSTLRLIDLIIDSQALPHFTYEVIPGVTSVSSLAARMQLVAHDIGEPLHITTGRQLREHGLQHLSTAVMLDADCSFTYVEDQEDTLIWWGAYLGMPDEKLIAGWLSEVSDEIIETRARLREQKGWIMDVYLLQTTPEDMESEDDLDPPME